MGSGHVGVIIANDRHVKSMGVGVVVANEGCVESMGVVVANNGHASSWDCGMMGGWVLGVSEQKKEWWWARMVRDPCACFSLFRRQPGVA